MSAPRTNVFIDIVTTPFNAGNKEHELFIENEVKIFTKQFNKLTDADLKVFAVPASVTSIMWLLGAYGTIMQIAALLLLSSARHLVNSESKNKYYSHLHRLMQIYRWCAKDVVMFSNNSTCLSLLKTLLPFLNRDELLIWNFDVVNLSELSDEFIKILALPPQQCILVGSKCSHDSSVAASFLPSSMSFPQSYMPSFASVLPQQGFGFSQFRGLLFSPEPTVPTVGVIDTNHSEEAPPTSTINKNEKIEVISQALAEAKRFVYRKL